MPRYVVERSFPNGMPISIADGGAERCQEIVEQNACEEVTWVTSYVSSDNSRMFCVYEAPSPEAIRTSAARNGLPVDRITRVRVLDPHFYA